MAKKKAKKKVSQPETPITPVEVASGSADSLVDKPAAPSSSVSPPPPSAALAWPVASIVNLENVIMEEFHAKRQPESFEPTDEMASGLTLAHTCWEGSTPQEASREDPNGRSRDKKDELPTSDPAILIQCQFVLIYAIPTFEGITEDQLGRAQTSGVFNVWPYWRQAVHATSFQLGVAPIVLPTHRMSEDKSSEANVSKEMQDSTQH